MPKISGIEMLKEMHKIKNNMYVIVISANSDQDSFMDTIKLGVKGYIIKSLNIKQLLGVLDVAVKNINVNKKIVDRSSTVYFENRCLSN